ncbi:hypothetical protein WOLCODRAFT_71695 [Wolfiporia cocos MD-104 SS10]|uniref:MYND-type domain-containing protein n=1 Tax=Wolfiporia cocos (strain MD-104) TaxID=742152 RepID=A0A2H3K0E4_WOLCO|nr:hypothetical protein WOLCODRAFT_71695 [Wolfiporia cocos MD-104 SS10]
MLQSFKSDEKISFDSSLIYRKIFDEFRVATFTSILGPDTEVNDYVPDSTAVTLDVRPKMSSLYKCGTSRQKTWLHYAAWMGDVPLAHECVRLGVTIDRKDQEGATALFLACDRMLLCAIIGRQVDMIEGDNRDILGFTELISCSPDQLQNQQWRCGRIAEMLVWQHANVNVKVGNMTPLQIACRLHDWPFVETLLSHGADPTICGTDVLLSYCHTPGTRLRLRQLLSAYTPNVGRARPERLCPCWSSKTLKDCHNSGTAQPFPPYFLCRCGSRKCFSKCCSRRGIRLIDQWDHPTQCIRTDATVTATISFSSPDVCDTFDQFQQYLRRYEDDKKAELGRGQIRHMERITDKLLGQKRLSIAYWFAMRTLAPFFAMPFDCTMPKFACKDLMSKWNAAVDQYIGLGTDGQSRAAIELEAKIGLDGGPVHKHCEATGCGNVDGVGGTTLKCCGACKRIMYCSARCQTADWVQHKRHCKDGKQVLQMLPSQRALKEEIIQTVEEALRRIHRRGDIQQAFEGDAMDAAAVTLIFVLSLQSFRDLQSGGADSIRRH